MAWKTVVFIAALAAVGCSPITDRSASQRTGSGGAPPALAPGESEAPREPTSDAGEAPDGEAPHPDAGAAAEPDKPQSPANAGRSGAGQPAGGRAGGSGAGGEPSTPNDPPPGCMCPEPENECEAARCEEGTGRCVTEPKPSGACASGVCNGRGTCVACVGDGQCSGDKRFCVNNQCVACKGQSDCTQPGNDCKVALCEAYACTMRDRPDDATCAAGTCSAGMCVDPDRDDDGVTNASDNCPTVPNEAQFDLDGDGMGAECDSSDNVTGRGTFPRFVENDFIDLDEEVGAKGAGMPIWWTRRNATSAWFYGQKGNNLEVADAQTTSIAAVTNAASLSFTNESLFVEVGQVIVWRNTDAGTYAAARLDLLDTSPGDEDWLAKLTWVYAGTGTNFSRL
jgi:hypothetical protein